MQEFAKYERKILLIIKMDEMIWKDMLKAGLQFVQNQNNRLNSYYKIEQRKFGVINRYKKGG